MIVTCDIHSTAIKGKIYATKGTNVEIISEHGEVLIVKTKKGNTFPVMRDKVV